MSISLLICAFNYLKGIFNNSIYSVRQLAGPYFIGAAHSLEPFLEMHLKNPAVYFEQETLALFISPIYEDYNNFSEKNMRSVTLFRKFKSRL